MLVKLRPFFSYLQLVYKFEKTFNSFLKRKHEELFGGRNRRRSLGFGGH